MERKGLPIWPIPEKCGKDPGEAWEPISIARRVETGLKIALQNESELDKQKEM